MTNKLLSMLFIKQIKVIFPFFLLSLETLDAKEHKTFFSYKLQFMNNEFYKILAKSMRFSNRIFKFKCCCWQNIRKYLINKQRQDFILEKFMNHRITGLSFFLIFTFEICFTTYYNISFNQLYLSTQLRLFDKICSNPYTITDKMAFYF